jgi:CHAT domain-containing protein
VVEEQAMHATLGRLGVLLLLAILVTAASAQPVPVPGDKAADPTATQQKLLAKAHQLGVAGSHHYQRGDFAKALVPWQEALEIYRQVYPRASYPNGHPDLLRSLNNLAAAQQAAGDYAKAGPLYEEALARYRALYPKERFPDGHADLAGSLNNLGNLYRAAADYARAEALLREALAMYRALYPKERFRDGHPELARSLNNLGVLYRAAGDYVQAEALLREALAMYRVLYPKDRFPHGHPGLTHAISNLGFLHQFAGEHAKAEPLFREALVMYRALYPRERFPHGHPELAMAINSLGTLYEATGDYAKAERLYDEALAMRCALYPKKRYPNGHPELAVSLNNLGTLHWTAGSFAKAELFQREALAMYRALYPKDRYPGGHSDLASSLNNLGVVCRDTADYAKAERLYSEALAMRSTLYPKERYPRGHLELAKSLNNLGTLHWAAGSSATAERFHREALAMYRALYPTERFPHGHPSLATAIHNLGTLYEAAGDHAKAQALLREALAMHGQLLRQFADLAAEAASQSFASTLPLARDSLLSNSRHLGKSAAAYDALWDGRAVLTRLQERRHRDLLASADPATAALAAELRHTRRRLAQLLLGPGRDADAHRQAVEKLTQGKEDLEKRIAQKLQLAALQPATAATTVQQLSAALPPGAAFVDLLRYVSFEQDPRTPGRKGAKRTACYVAFVVGKDQPVARVELHEAAPIEQAWAAWREALLAPGGAEKTERAAARAFAKLVWEPLRAVLPADGQTVYLTPDGALAQVPWAALPGRKPGTALLEDHGVCLVPHGPWLLERLQARPAYGGDTLVAYGGIDYEGAPAVVAKSQDSRDLELASEEAVPIPAEKRLLWLALPGTAREQMHIVALAKQALKAPAIVRSGRAAGTEQLLEDLPQARYVHLATHGFFADARFRSYLQIDPKLYEQGALGERRSPGGRSPLVLSGLVLAGANRRGKDAALDQGIVTAEGLIGLRLEGLELAVLSACETGLGEVAGGEGVFGLQRAFHIAGCQNVVASLWQVDDEATAALMGLFYHKLWVEKLPAAEALRQAQLALNHHPERIGPLARARGPDFEKAARLPATPQATGRAPARLWAGFVLSGLGR